MKHLKDDLGIPTKITALQVVLSAVIAAFVRLVFRTNWLLALISFILVFAAVYMLIGVIYLKLKK